MYAEFVRRFKNFVIILTLYILTISVTVYGSVLLATYLIWGFEYLTFDLKEFLNVYNAYIWLSKYYNRISLDHNEYFAVKLVASTIGPVLLLLIIFLKYRTQILGWRPYKKKEALHGDAKWADEDNIKKAGLRAKHGILLGKDKNGYFIAEGYQHALLFAPTGSGKGVGFVIPNLLFWNESVIVHDIKLENYELTSGWRAKLGQQVFVWSPADPDGLTHCYNPIDWVSSKPGQMVDDVQKIANLIMPEKEFWNNEARSLFVGVVLYLLAVPEKVKSFGEVVRTMRSDDVAYNLAVVLDTIGKQIHPVAYMNIAAFLQKADKERSGVISTMNSSLELWANPLIDTATATSDFDIQTFKKQKTSVYVGVTPDNIQRLEPLMQVFYQQATEFLSRRIPKAEEEPYGVLFVMDEFPTLGKMEQFKTGIAYFRGYHVRLFLIIQDTEQLKGIYEEAGMNSFLSNSTYRITFAANNMETANLISQLCGNKTVEQASQNKPKYLDFNPASRSLHVSEAQRALLLPQEVILLPRDEQIVLIESFPPIKSKKIRYYEDKFFTKRLLPPTFIPTQEPFDPNKFRQQREAGNAKKSSTKQEEELKAIENNQTYEEEIADHEDYDYDTDAAISEFLKDMENPESSGSYKDDNNEDNLDELDLPEFPDIDKDYGNYGEEEDYEDENYSEDIDFEEDYTGNPSYREIQEDEEEDSNSNTNLHEENNDTGNLEFAEDHELTNIEKEEYKEEDSPTSYASTEETSTEENEDSEDGHGWLHDLEDLEDINDEESDSDLELAKEDEEEDKFTPADSGPARSVNYDSNSILSDFLDRSHEESNNTQKPDSLSTYEPRHKTKKDSNFLDSDVGGEENKDEEDKG